MLSLGKISAGQRTSPIFKAYARTQLADGWVWATISQLPSLIENLYFKGLPLK
jgi:hypothetical protein